MPAVFRMDGAPGFTSQVMSAFSRLLGVRHHDVSAPASDDPTHHSMVERRNQVTEKLLDVAVPKGDIQQLADLGMYCAAATAACNLEYVYHGHTVLEYLTGEVPRTHRDMATPMDVPTILGDMDESFLQDLRNLLVEKHGLLARDRNPA